MYIIFIIVALSVLLQACSQPSTKETAMICDADACVERARGYENPDTKPSASPEELARVAALEEAASNDPRAAYDLGLRYFRGDGIRQNSYEAVTWMRSAAERGDLEAQKALGRLYLTGLEEMGADPAEAEVWLGLAASRGDTESAELLEQAQAAKATDRAYYEWLRRWRGVIGDYWYYRYPYRAYWREGRWYYH